MPKILLAPYAFRIKERNAKSYLKFKDVFKNPTTLNLLENFLLGLKTKFTDDETGNTLLRISSSKKSNQNNYIHGIIETGEYGIESKFYDKNGDHKYDRKKDHAEIMPFYFLIGIDDKMDTGIFILQRYGQYGISKIFLRSLREYINNEKPELTLKIEPVISEDALQKIIKDGELKKVTFNKFTLPTDLASSFEGKNSETSAYVQMSIIARRNKGLNIGDRLNSVLFGNGDVKRLLAINNFDYDETKITVDYNGTMRTISLGSRKFRAFYDVTNNVKLNSNNHPEFNSIDTEAKQLMKDLFLMLIK